MNENEEYFEKKNNQKDWNNLLKHLNIKNLKYDDDISNIINDSDSEQVEQVSCYEQNTKSNQLSLNNVNVLKNLPIRNDLSLLNENKETKISKKFKIKKNNFRININSTTLEEEKNSTLPPQYFYDKIKKEIFPKLNLKDEIKKSFIKNDTIMQLEDNISDKYFFSKKKRNRGKTKSKEKIQKPKGRKKNVDTSKSNHNKDSPDNIIKKIKSKLLHHYLLNFINDLLNSILKEETIKSLKKSTNEKDQDKEKIIKKINYKQIVDDMKKENNLNFLQLSLKDLLSKNISQKYSTFSEDINKKIINEILLREEDDDIISYIFNLTFGEWFDVFTFKKEIKDVIFFDEEKQKIIMNKFERVDNLLEDIYSNNNKNYFSCFLYLLYNFERWFFVKQGRQRKEKIKKNKEKDIY